MRQGDQTLLRSAASGLLAVVLTSSLSAAMVQAKGDEPQSRPNILLVLSDDMGFSDLGCYGGEIRTPALDALALNGLRFTSFYNTARCCPTRASLLTGLHPHQAGMGGMEGQRRDAEGNVLPGYTGGINGNCVTIAEVLRGAGYGTYMSGKWHVTRHWELDSPKHNWPIQRGFDRFYGTIRGAGSFYDPASLCRQNTFITPRNDPEYRPERYYYTDAISDNAIAYLEEHHAEHPEAPFFLYVAYTSAHWPMHALSEDIAKYEGVYDAGYESIRRARHKRLRELGLVGETCELSPGVGDWEDLEHREWEIRCMEVYAAMVDRMDQGIGRIVDSLREAGELDNTLVLFLQDNGGCAERLGREEPGDWGNAEAWTAAGGEPMKPDELQPNIWPPMRTRDTGEPLLGGPRTMPGPDGTYVSYGRSWANVSNAPFREFKHWVHEGGISTPLIVHWPAGIEARGELRHQPACLLDVMATCVDVTGAQYPAAHGGREILPMQGVSLLPNFAGETLERDTFSWEHEANCAIRVGDWKLVRKSGKPWELYDLARDRAELHDRASKHPGRVEEMASRWETWAVEAQVLPRK